MFIEVMLSDFDRAYYIVSTVLIITLVKRWRIAGAINSVFKRQKKID